MFPISKYASRGERGPDDNLFWGRSGQDGFPIRSSGGAPLLRDQEFEDRFVKVGDFKNGIFDVTVEADRTEESGKLIYGNRSYQNILDCVVNKWFQLWYIDRGFNVERNLFYVEWVEYFYEDSRPAKAPVSQGGSIADLMPPMRMR